MLQKTFGMLAPSQTKPFGTSIDSVTPQRSTTAKVTSSRSLTVSSGRTSTGMPCSPTIAQKLNPHKTEAGNGDQVSCGQMAFRKSWFGWRECAKSGAVVNAGSLIFVCTPLRGLLAFCPKSKSRKGSRRRKQEEDTPTAGQKDKRYSNTNSVSNSLRNY